jgi:ion channel
MTLRNFAVGVPAMLLCLIVQVVVVFWCVRYCTRQTDGDASSAGWLRTIRPLSVSMLAMMIANLLQIALWGVLFVGLGEFEELYPAIYHSAVNFTSLGYGDVVMKQDWKLLGPLEAANGVLMMSMTAAAMTAILQNIIRSQTDAIVVGRDRRSDSGK